MREKSLGACVGSEAMTRARICASLARITRAKTQRHLLAGFVALRDVASTCEVEEVDGAIEEAKELDVETRRNDSRYQRLNQNSRQDG